MAATRTDGLLSLAVLTALSLSLTPSFAQTQPASPGTIIRQGVDDVRPDTGFTRQGADPVNVPSTAPAKTSSLVNGVTVTPTTAPSSNITVTQPFVGAVTAEKVYIRSGPGGAYYEMGQLSRGDLVQVVGARLGWYQVLPPNGTFCMIAKEFVEVDAGGTTGTVLKDYINVRAGTALYKNREPSAVLCTVRKGAKLTVLGSTDTYYEIAPPDKAYVYISPQFIQQKPDATYTVPNLKLPPGVTGPSKDTVMGPPTTLPSATVEITPRTETPTPTPTPTATPTTPTVDEGNTVTATTEPAKTVIVPPTPVTFSPTAAARFNELNTRYQDELRQPLVSRQYDALIKDYQALAAEPNLQPSIKQGTASRITALEKLQMLQKLAKDNNASSENLAAQQKALQQQYASAEQAIKDYENSGPYAAEGILQTSTAVQGKYAVVDPLSGRVAAYVDPASDIDIASLLGKYIGVRGPSHRQEGTELTVITAKTATLLPAPKPAAR